MKKAISILLSFILIITSTFCFGVTASADDEVFTYDKTTKTLTVDVKGTVYQWQIDELTYKKEEIERVNVQNGVTELGLGAFASLKNIKKLVVLNPDCVFNNNGVLPNRRDITIYSSDNSSTSAAKIHAINHGYNFKLVYFVSFINDNGVTVVNALEDYTAEDLAREAPSLSITNVLHNNKTGYDTYCKWEPEIAAPKDFKGPYEEKLINNAKCEDNLSPEPNIIEATCTKDGKREEICALCGRVVKSTVIPAKGHDFGDNNELEYCKNCTAKNPHYTPPTTTTEPTSETKPTTSTTVTQPTTAVSTTQVPATTVSTTSTPSNQTVTSTVTASSAEYQVPITAAQTTKTADTTKKATATKKSNKTVKKPKNTKIKKLTSKKANLTITWSKISGVKGYQIQVATDKKFKKNKKTVTIKKQKTTKKTIKKLKSGKKYYVRIRTYKISKNKKVYSSWTKAKKVKIK